MSLYDDIAKIPQIARGKVWCRKCGKEQSVNGKNAIRTGWPECCGETMTIDSPDGYVKGCDCLKSDTECLPMSKHLEEGAESILSIAGYDVEGFWFTPEEFQIYRSQLLKEQREICAKHAEVIYEPVIPGGGRTAEYIPEVDKDSIINAPEPG